MQTNLILGATGTIGTRLLNELALQGMNQRMKIIGASRSAAGAEKVQALGFESIFVDLNDPQSVKLAVKGVTTLFLLKPYGLKMLNYAKSVVEAAAEAGVQAIVNLSAFGPDHSATDLLTWHRFVDRYVESFGLSFTHVRPSFFMEGLVARVDPQTRVVYDLSGSKDVPWVATADIARVLAAIIDDTTSHKGKAYSLISEVWSAPRVANLLSELTGTDFKAVAMDEEKAVGGLVARGREPGFARAIIEYAKLAPTFAASDATDTVRAITGNPATSLRNFLEGHPLIKKVSALA